MRTWTPFSLEPFFPASITERQALKKRRHQGIPGIEILSSGRFFAVWYQERTLEEFLSGVPESHRHDCGEILLVRFTEVDVVSGTFVTRDGFTRGPISAFPAKKEGITLASTHMEILFSAERIAERIAAMGSEITDFYRGKPLTLVALMNGGICFAADLMRAIKLPIWVDSIGVASYANCASTGVLDFRSSLKLDPKGREILLLDEVLDTGTTLKRVSEKLRDLGASGVRTAVMVEKTIPRPNGVAHADWAGFTAPMRYLVGYGLDADERYRNLPCIAALD